MSSSMCNGFVHAEYNFFWVCTNPLMKFTLSLVWSKFSSIKREGRCDVIKKMKEPKLGDAPVGHPSLFQEDSSVKAWGCPRHPLLHQQTIRSSLVKLYFNSDTSYVLYLKRLFVFVFVFVIFILWIKWILAFLRVGERHAPLFHLNTPILRLYSLSILL